MSHFWCWHLGHNSTCFCFGFPSPLLCFSIVFLHPHCSPFLCFVLLSFHRLPSLSNQQPPQYIHVTSLTEGCVFAGPRATLSHSASCFLNFTPRPVCSDWLEEEKSDRRAGPRSPSVSLCLKLYCIDKVLHLETAPSPLCSISWVLCLCQTSWASAPDRTGLHWSDWGSLWSPHYGFIIFCLNTWSNALFFFKSFNDAQFNAMFTRENRNSPPVVVFLSLLLRFFFYVFGWVAWFRLNTAFGGSSPVQSQPLTISGRASCTVSFFMFTF